MAKVLKVVISVVAPEKSIVPWAWATLVSESARRVGAIVRMAHRRCCLTDRTDSRVDVLSNRRRRPNRFTLYHRRPGVSVMAVALLGKWVMGTSLNGWISRDSAAKVAS